MQTMLLDAPTVDVDELEYRQAALRECVQYGEHGVEIEMDEDGQEVCFNCGVVL
jgi:hypothetical protein